MLSALSAPQAPRLTPSDTYSKVLRRPLSSKEDIDELPFSIPDADLLLRNPDPDGQVNRFKVRAGQSLQEWEKAGWIWSEDPRGWAQWYTRFWDGRRCEDDERQVRRCGCFTLAGDRRTGSFS